MTDLHAPRTGSPLPRDFYAADGLTLARELLGKVLIRREGDRLLACVITETEAYMGVGDRASHAYGGRRTQRTRTMYRAGGVAYVYLIYGLYSCMNITANREGNAEAMLIRAGLPAAGEDVMLENLRRSSRAKKASLPASPAAWSGKEWAERLRGPGRLCSAMGITRADNGRELFSDPGFYVEDWGLGPGIRPAAVLTGPRIGIDYAGEDRDKPWRFVWDAEADGFMG